MSFAPTTQPKLPGYVCDGGGICPQPKPPIGACDGGGLVARPNVPEPGEIGAAIVNKIKEARQTSDTVEISGKENAEQKSSKKKTMLGAAILLIGGALLGYGHKDYISKGVNKAKESLGKFFAEGKPAELLQKGKGLVAKVKDMIFAKPKQV